MDIMLERILELVGSKHGAAQNLTDAIGLPRNSVTGWRSGRLKSYKKYAKQIADFYGVSLDWLSGLTDEKEIKKASPDEPARPNRDRFQKMAATLSEEKYAVLLKVLEAMEEQ